MAILNQSTTPSSNDIRNKGASWYQYGMSNDLRTHSYYFLCTLRGMYLLLNERMFGRCSTLSYTISGFTKKPRNIATTDNMVVKTTDKQTSKHSMLCTAQLGGPVLKPSGRVQYTPVQLGDKSPMITDQHTTGGSVSQLNQLAKLSPWLTISAKDITASFWYYNKV